MLAARTGGKWACLRELIIIMALLAGDDSASERGISGAVMLAGRAVNADRSGVRDCSGQGFDV